MKQILIIIALCLAIFAKPIHAVMESVPVDFSSPSASVKEEEYILPYPGILLDHPLYIFKNLRDMVMEFLISDPVKKHEFAILQTDKFLGMAIKYAETGKWNYVESALTKSKDAAGAAVTKFLQASGDQEKNPSYVKDRLIRSLSKQAEVLEGFIQNAPDNQKQFINNQLKTILQWRESLLVQK